jgi:adenylyltransferase/sulfurtransferase
LEEKLSRHKPRKYVMNLQLTEEEKQRYNRQIILPSWGVEGQKKVKKAVVFIAGAGGLGSPVAIYLAAAGIGTIRICDNSEPELSNLNRQILHTDRDIGKKKAISAQETLYTINPYVLVEPLPVLIEKENVDSLVGDAQIIVDCMDNFPTRHILNECAVRKGIPFVHGGVIGMCGQITFIHTPQTPCLKCIYPGSPPRTLFPVVGATPGVIGTLQALEVLKFIIGIGENLKGRLLVWDGERMVFEEIRIKKHSDCPVCS